MMVRAHVWVSGRVQGVFFRSETRRMARKRGVEGWVRNVPDGRVEAVFEGEREDVEALVEYCKRGPTGAQVAGVQVVFESPTGESEGFRIVW